MTRRWLTLCMVLCLLAGALAAFPASPTLVCRVTGEPMPPAAATEAHKTCCAVAPAAITAEGATRYRLASPGCCDLRQATERAEQPFVFAAAPEPVSPGWAPAPPVLFVPPVVETVSYAPAIDRSAPRAPPGRSSAPRAPPVLS